MRNKQRKARRKAEQESAQAAQAQVKREHHHKSKCGDVEADAPQLDELIPDKLARVFKLSNFFFVKCFSAKKLNQNNRYGYFFLGK